MQTWLTALLLVGLFIPPPSEAAQPRANCRSTIPGITYCIEDGGDTHLLRIDLTHPNLHVQTIMANDVLDVRPLEEERERVVDMARRYRADGAVIVINGDYFGAERGPEGPTVVQGQRLDTLAAIRLNPSRYRRTTLAIARFGQASIGQLNPRLDLPAAVYDTALFNAISGGPITLRNGEIVPEAMGCLLDRIPANTCRRNRQSAAGIDASGRTLFLIVSTLRSSAEVAELLRNYGAAWAMKLDAGGSSQLWYNGRTLLDSDRGVANALAVFVEDRPRHAAQLTARSAIPILAVNERSAITLTLRNTGFLAWLHNRGYGLRVIGGASLIDRETIAFPFDLPLDSSVTLNMRVNATNWPGVYESTWHMTGQGGDFGEDVPIRVVVIPNHADDLRTEIRNVINTLRPNRFERDWPSVAARIRKMLDQWAADHPAPSEDCVGRQIC